MAWSQASCCDAMRLDDVHAGYQEKTEREASAAVAGMAIKGAAAYTVTGAGKT